MSGTIIDPDKSNLKTINAYKNASFEAVADFLGSTRVFDGLETVLMVEKILTDA
ncbi:hypothetical protein [Pseudomonas aeruginosa]|uniref:hypothetical protein n=1 Tax=Pseudomonas aeruginosa TaxID=287 RepID=UPI0013CDDFEC|nr:hypothetical protein [Pseudomonas aeruginosa]